MEGTFSHTNIIQHTYETTSVIVTKRVKLEMVPRSGIKASLKVRKEMT